MKTNLKATLCALLAVCITLIFCGCAVSSTASTELGKDYTRSENIKPGEVSDSFKSAASGFGFKLFYELIDKKGKNLLLSPASAIMCLGMLTNGADGNTLAQLESVLGMTSAQLNEAVYSYSALLKSEKDCKLAIANSVWFRNEEGRLTLNKEFLQTNADWYGIDIYAAPFDSTTKDEINRWCSKNTDGMIDRILDNDIPDATVMYIINALMFDAQWEDKYEKSDVIDHSFNSYDGTSKQIKFLSSSENTYIKGDNESGFVKNYAGGRFAFVGVLPNEGIDIYDYLKELDGESWLGLWNSRVAAEVSVLLPEFEYEVDLDLKPVLSEMGVTDLFDNAAADLSRLGSSSTGNLYCSELKQKAVIKVDRSGTKAAAITWGAVNDEAAQITINTVILDRPFVYAIVDTQTGLPVFIGAMVAA